MYTPRISSRAAVVLAMVLSTCILQAAPAVAQVLTRGPYLQNVTPTSVVLRFELDAPAPVEVHLGPDTSYTTVVDAGSGPGFIVNLGGLTPGEPVHYTLVSGGETLEPDHMFFPAPPPRAGFKMLVLGDTRSNHADHAEVVNAALGEKARVLIHTGDLVSSGEVEDDWVQFFHIEQPLLQSTPIFPVIGNHEEHDGHVNLMMEYFTNPIDSPSPEHYYSVDYGNVHLVVMDGHVNVDPEWVCLTRIAWWETCFTVEQLDWLEADLASARTNPDIDHIFVFNHMGPYSSKEGRTGMKHMRDLMDLFASHGVSFVISGHDHYYERGFSGNGIPYIISAGGGAPLYDIASPSPAPHTVVYNESCLHYTLFDFDYLDVTMTVYRIDGTVLDSYSFTADARPCVSAFDCGALPPDCAEGAWACVAGSCEIATCEPPVEPEPEESPEEPGHEPVAEAVLEPVEDAFTDTAIPPDAPADTAGPEDAGTDPAPPDAGEDPGPSEDTRAGCGCLLVR